MDFKINQFKKINSINQGIMLNIKSKNKTQSQSTLTGTTQDHTGTTQDIG